MRTTRGERSPLTRLNRAARDFATLSRELRDPGCSEDRSRGALLPCGKATVERAVIPDDRAR